MKPVLVSELIASAEAEMTAKGRTAHTKSAMMTIFRQFQNFADKCGSSYYSSELIAQFFDCYRGGSPRYHNRICTKESINRKRAALNRLDWLYKHGTFDKGRKPVKPPLPSYYANIMEKFDKWQCKRNYAANTKKAMHRTTSSFIDFLIETGIETVETIDAMHISDFILKYRGSAPATMKCDLGRLRTFLRFLFLEGLTSKNFAEFVPEFHYGNIRMRESNIWSKEELATVLSSINRGSATGKRDYAACLLAADLGMRTADISALKLNDIRWDPPCSIEFTQAKTKNTITLPLPERIGLALIDYLKYGRPKTECPNVFVKHIPPYDVLECLSSIFCNKVAESGIPKKYNRKYGLHSLRHTVATRMLENGVEFDKIAPFLGHADESTLHIYLNYDIEHLRQCALAFEPEMMS